MFIVCARTIAASGSLNPRWFGHPGSTFIYPLAAIYWVFYTVVYGGASFTPDRQIHDMLVWNQEYFILLARLLTVVYALLAIVFVYRVGGEVFGKSAAVIGAFLAALHPTEAFNKQARPDSACVLFAMLALWRCLRLFERPTLRNQIWAGVTIGLAISTKYTLGILAVILVLVDAHIIWRCRAEAGRLRRAAVAVVVGLAAIPVVFGLSTPYFVLDYATATQTLGREFRVVQSGADGLSPSGNFLFYLSVLPHALSWPQLIAALVGIGLSLWRRRAQALLLLAFAAALTVSISPHPLHWERWLIPILPVLALFAAYGAWETIAQVSAQLKLSWSAHAATVALGVALLAWSSVGQLVEIDRAQARPSTHVQARQWITANLPPGSHLAFEWSTVPDPLELEPLNLAYWIAHDGGRNFVELSMSRLSVRRTVRAYIDKGYRYLITSSWNYAYYPARADRYPEEAAFYSELLATGRLVHEVAPAVQQRGPSIRIYEIEQDRLGQGDGKGAP